MAKVGNIRIPGDVEVWPHEYRTALSLARAGHDVTFIKKSDVEHERTPDVLIDGERWEMKAPKASNARAIDRNVRRALKQSPRLVIDSRRMKDLPDSVAERELRKHARDMRTLKRLVFVSLTSPSRIFLPAPMRLTIAVPMAPAPSSAITGLLSLRSNTIAMLVVSLPLVALCLVLGCPCAQALLLLLERHGKEALAAVEGIDCRHLV